MPIKLKDYQTNFDRGAHPSKEFLWILTKIVFFLLPLPLPSKLRCLILKAFGAKIGTGVIVRAGVDVTFPWRLSIDNYSWIGEDVKLLNLAAVSIGSNCCISQQAFLCTGSHDFKSDEFNLITQEITVLDSSWIAAQSFIGPGVRIGPGSMIAANSMVARNVEAYQIVSGNPARVINLSAEKTKEIGR